MKREVKIRVRDPKSDKDVEKGFSEFATSVAEHVLGEIGLEHSEGTALESTYHICPCKMKDCLGRKPDTSIQKRIFEWMYEFFSQHKIGIMINGHLTHVSPYTVKRVMWGEDMCDSFYLYPNKAVARMLYDVEDVSAGLFGDWIEANKEA